MSLTPEAIQELNNHVSMQMNERMLDLPSADTLCKNKGAILEFIDGLSALLPGVFGKAAGQAVKIAAEAWFKKRGC